ERQETRGVSGIESFDAAVGTARLSRSDHQTGERAWAMAAGAGSAASGAVSRTAGTDDASDHPGENRNVAVVACARKLAVLLWHVLTSGEPFRYAPPKSLEAKYARPRVRATGRRRRGGVAKGTPRSARYGRGGCLHCLRFLGCC